MVLYQHRVGGVVVHPRYTGVMLVVMRNDGCDA